MLHGLVAECEGGTVGVEEVARTRALIYAARGRDSIAAQSPELAEAREQILELRQTLQSERDERLVVEDELRALRAQRMVALCWETAGERDDPARETFKPTTITKHIDAELRWVEWAQEVLLMVVSGSTEMPPEPDQPTR
ncbi:hypothetical protein BX285_0150 [Streptomyces sp. 1114.5]|nr:hypothetical protein BX285_0150 [Streptomyces sp. 1114.5]